jgi:hypothetical protein
MEWRVVATGVYKDEPPQTVELKRFDSEAEAEEYAAREMVGNAGHFKRSVHVESRQAGPWERSS